LKFVGSMMLTWRALSYEIISYPGEEGILRLLKASGQSPVAEANLNCM